MGTKHKHYDLIVAWAEGAEIQHYCQIDKIWIDNNAPAWSEATEYRIKPEPLVLTFKIALLKDLHNGFMYPTIIYPPNYKKPRENRLSFVRWLTNEMSFRVTE